MEFEGGRDCSLIACAAFETPGYTVVAAARQVHCAVLKRFVDMKWVAGVAALKRSSAFEFRELLLEVGRAVDRGSQTFV